MAFIALSLAVASSAIGVTGPLILGRIVEIIHSEGYSRTLDRLGIAFAILVLAQALLTRFLYSVLGRLGERILTRLREDLVARLLAMPLGMSESAGVGDLLTRATKDVDVLSTCVRLAVPEVLIAVFRSALVVLVLALVSPYLLMPILLGASVFALGTRWYARRADTAYLRQNAAYAAVTDSLAETTTGTRTVEALGRQRQRVALTDRLLGRSWRAERYTLFLRTVWWPTTEAAYLLTLIPILLLAGMLYLNGTLPLGLTVAAVIYVQLLIDPLDRLLSWLDELQVGRASLARILGVGAAPDPAAAGDSLPERASLLQLHGARFGYNSSREVVHGIDLAVEPGERLAVVGPSGGGKSTLGLLLAGIHQPTTGTVTVGDVPLNSLSPKRRRHEIMLVGRDQHVFAGTLRDNLDFVAPDATDQEIRRALATVSALSWVDELPDGLDTVVGDGGVALTPPWTQQLALARVLLRPPNVLVLDEATSLLDSPTARAVNRALDEALAGRTIVTIDHRLILAYHADRVVVIEDGRVGEVGSHQQLAQANGTYAELWRLWLLWHGSRARQPVNPALAVVANERERWARYRGTRAESRAWIPSDGDPALWLPDGRFLTLDDVVSGHKTVYGPAHEPPPPRRWLVGNFPSHARLGAEISLTVRIIGRSSSAPQGHAAMLRPLEVGASGIAVTVIVEPGPGLTARGPMEQTTHVPVDGDSDPVRFVFRAGTVSLQRLHVTAWAGGTFLAELEFEVSVTALGPDAGTQVKSSGIEDVRAEAGEVTLQVRRDRDRYTFQLLSDTQLFDPVIVESVSSGPDETTEHIIQTVRRLARRTAGYSPGNARRLLQNTGIALWNSLVPEAVREQFWQVRSGITTFSIATGMDTVPWELLYPISRTEDSGFLIEQMPVTRRVYNQPRSRTVSIGRARFVVPPESPRNAGAEVDALSRIVSGDGDPSVVTELAELLRLVDAGGLGLMHFACHNTYQAGSAGSAIAMEDGDFVPTLLEHAKSTGSLATSQPLIFINACRSADSVPHYTRMMGWAQQFLAAGAGAFVGTLWDVRSSSAQAFAEEFYTHLVAGLTLGQASFRARVAAARQDDDPTWLAYSVYGDPNAVPVNEGWSQ
ncbi:ABC transporter transmembrane domain-containing protein [Actinoplanes sp. HUAS TT8]|uniref:ABC transporter transmembrane domain-containing protein n=1 Tax=Actinoplanes sp. HUAS TT8 TaxID=3447453 RepID=UPI003F5274C3